MGRHVYKLFFAVSLFFTVMLFCQLADNLISQILMFASGVAFELGKIYLWKQYKETRSKVSFFFCMLFIALSITASISFTAGLMKNQYLMMESAGKAAVNTNKDIKSIDKEINDLTITMNSLSPQYITSKLRLSARIEELRGIKAEKLCSVSSSAISKAAIVFKDMGQTFHMPPVRLIFIFFTLFAILLEAGAILLAPFEEKEKEQTSTPPEKEQEPKDESITKKFGELLWRGDKAPLRGVSSIAQELGITERQARSIYESLKSQGFIKTHGKHSYPALDKDAYFKKLQRSC